MVPEREREHLLAVVPEGVEVGIHAQELRLQHEQVALHLRGRNARRVGQRCSSSLSG